MSKLLSTSQAAALMNVSEAGMRSLARFARNRGIELRAPEDEWLDRRTPMYDEEKLIRYRDVQRPNRQWPIPLDEQKKSKDEAKSSTPARKRSTSSRSRAKATAAS